MSVFGSTFLFLQDSYLPRRTSVRFSPSLRNVGLRIDFFVFAGFVSAVADERLMLSFATKCRSSDRLFCFCRIHIRLRRTSVRFSPPTKCRSSDRLFVLQDCVLSSFATKCRSSDRLFCFCRIPIRRGGRAFDALLRYEMSVFGSTILFCRIRSRGG